MHRRCDAVLRSPDLLLLVCQYQPGLWQDLLPFNCTPGYFIEPDALLSPWLAKFGHTRATRLVNTFPEWKPHVLEHAARHGDLDLFKVMAECFSKSAKRNAHWLSSVAASAGHLPILEFVHSKWRLPDPKWLTRTAVDHGHLHVVQYLTQTYPLREWFRGSTLVAASQLGQLPLLESCFQSWAPHATKSERNRVEKWALVCAVQRRQWESARWLAIQMHQDGENRAAIAHVWAGRAKPACLLDLVHPIDAVEYVLMTACPRRLLERLQLVFALLPSLHDDNPLQKDAVLMCVARSIARGHVDVLHWLVHTKMVRRDDVIDVAGKVFHDPTFRRYARPPRMASRFRRRHATDFESQTSEDMHTYETKCRASEYGDWSESDDVDVVASEENDVIVRGPHNKTPSWQIGSDCNPPGNSDSDDDDIAQDDPVKGSSVYANLRYKIGDLVLFLRGHGVVEDPPLEMHPWLVQDVLFDAVGNVPLAMLLLQGQDVHAGFSSAKCFQLYTRGSRDRIDYVHTLSRWILGVVDTEVVGGRVAVMGQLLVGIAWRRSTPRIFARLYATWLSEVMNDVDKERTNDTLLSRGNAKIVNCVAQSHPNKVALLQHALNTNKSLRVVQWIYNIVTESMDTEEIERLDSHLIATTALEP
ncbi:Aste57867_19879 [Aphanomyces stellatus]|uniref:Aste57867_19879 protein n=1 Tax=Aphanomyces stellatus TaxID=120398 RepID=A0A485LFI8_9STRA|nr:hypothetical protein As57867_019813 [Aphanomyces stellatus]VFT96577.1 Aste57867_19879 [Aphanomyces stellatus]